MTTSSTILVSGGTGLLGRKVVDALEREGVDVRPISRGNRPPFPENHAIVDLVKGEGLAEAMKGVSAIVHCAHDSTSGEASIGGLTNLLAAARTAGVTHFVYVGIAGIDEAGDFSYYATKLEEERLVMESGLGWTILRAAQFHTLIDAMLKRLNTAPMLLFVPSDITFRPVDIRTVANRLAFLALGPPRGRVRDLVGPQALTVDVLARQWLRAKGQWKLVFTLPSHSPGFVAFRKLVHGDAETAGPDWAMWLAQNIQRRRL